MYICYHGRILRFCIGSSSSLSGRKGALTPTPRTPEGGRVTPLRRKAATPTPRGVARTPPPHR